MDAMCDAVGLEKEYENVTISICHQYTEGGKAWYIQVSGTLRFDSHAVDQATGLLAAFESNTCDRKSPSRTRSSE